MNLLLFPLPLGGEGGPLPAFLPAGAGRVRGLRKTAYYGTMRSFPYLLPCSLSITLCLLSTAYCLLPTQWEVTNGRS
jgi:hypothetical protein